MLFLLCLETSSPSWYYHLWWLKNVGRCNDPAFHQNLHTQVNRCSPRLFRFVLLSVLRELAFSRMLKLQMSSYDFVYIAVVFIFLVMRTVRHVSERSSDVRKIDFLQLLLTHVQGMCTPVRLMHFFSCVKKVLMRLWNCTYRLEFGFGRRDAVIQPLGAKNEKSSTIYAKGWKQMDVIFAILRIERLWWPGNMI